MALLISKHCEIETQSFRDVVAVYWTSGEEAHEIETQSFRDVVVV